MKQTKQQARLLKAGQRAVTAPGWAWFPGILVTLPGIGLARTHEVGVPVLRMRNPLSPKADITSRRNHSAADLDTAIPMFDDPTTLAVLRVMADRSASLMTARVPPHGAGDIAEIEQLVELLWGIVEVSGE